MVPTNLEFGSFDPAVEVPDEGLLLFNHRPGPRNGLRFDAFRALWHELLRLRRCLGTARLPPRR